jgi:hypothetical protein
MSEVVGTPPADPVVEPVTTEPTQPTPQGATVPQEALQTQEPAWLPDRLERAKQTAVKDLLGELGVGSPDEIKALLEAKRQAEEAGKTELEKATARAAELEQRLAEEAATRQRIEREVGFRDAWTAAGKPAENLSAALKLVEWPEGDPDFGKLVTATVTAYPVLDPEPPKPTTGGANGRRTSTPPGPSPNASRWDSITRVPVQGE